MNVFVLVQNFVSHDMFVPLEAKMGNPKVVGVYSSREEAEKHIRPNADDYIIQCAMDMEPLSWSNNPS